MQLNVRTCWSSDGDAGGGRTSSGKIISPIVLHSWLVGWLGHSALLVGCKSVVTVSKLVGWVLLDSEKIVQMAVMQRKVISPAVSQTPYYQLPSYSLIFKWLV